jgi:hypothetical protein
MSKDEKSQETDESKEAEREKRIERVVDRVVDRAVLSRYVECPDCRALIPRSTGLCKGCKLQFDKPSDSWKPVAPEAGKVASEDEDDLLDL